MWAVVFLEAYGPEVLPESLRFVVKSYIYILGEGRIVSLLILRMMHVFNRLPFALPDEQNYILLKCYLISTKHRYHHVYHVDCIE